MSTIPGLQNTNRKIFAYDALADGDYPARIVRFTGLGTQPQPDYDGQPKRPAFKATFTLELIGVDTTGEVIENIGTDEEKRTPMEPKPACQFYDVFLFPGGKRGKVFDLCNVLEPGITAVPGSMEWFESKLGQVVNVKVGSYELKKGPRAGTRKNTVRGISSIPDMFKSQVGEARCESNYFDPYEESDKMAEAYNNLYKFQREALVAAIDSEHIPYAGKEPARQNDEANSAPATANDSKPAAPKAEDANGFTADDSAPF